MPFPMKIQPVDFTTVEESSRYDSFKPVPKSRFKRLFERQFSGLLRSSAPEKLVTGEDLIGNKKDASEEFEPSSVCLAKMVQTFIEEGEDKHRCNRSRCNCFNCNGTESSEEENDSVNCFGESNQNCCSDACEILKVLHVLRPCSAFKANLVSSFHFPVLNISNNCLCTKQIAIFTYNFVIHSLCC